MAHKKFTQEEIASWPPEHKKCRGCHEVLAFEKFNKNKSCLLGHETNCKDCRRPNNKKEWQKQTFADTMYRAAKHRAKKKGREFTIEKSDIVIPEECPIFKVPLIHERNHPYAPSLDRLNPNLGYTPDNIVVMSARANLLKNNMTPYEALLMHEWLEENGNYQQVMGLERVVGSVTYTRPGGKIVDVTVLTGELHPGLPEFTVQ